MSSGSDGRYFVKVSMPAASERVMARRIYRTSGTPLGAGDPPVPWWRRWWNRIRWWRAIGRGEYAYQITEVDQDGNETELGPGPIRWRRDV